MKGYAYCCIERENSCLYDTDFIERDKFVLTPKEAVALWKHLCNIIIDYLSKDDNEVTVAIEEHKNRFVESMTVIDCCFYKNDEYAGYATLSFSKD